MGFRAFCFCCPCFLAEEHEGLWGLLKGFSRLFEFCFFLNQENINYNKSGIPRCCTEKNCSQSSWGVHSVGERDGLGDHFDVALISWGLLHLFFFYSLVLLKAIFYFGPYFLVPFGEYFFIFCRVLKQIQDSLFMSRSYSFCLFLRRSCVCFFLETFSLPKKILRIYFSTSFRALGAANPKCYWHRPWKTTLPIFRESMWRNPHIE